MTHCLSSEDNESTRVFTGDSIEPERVGSYTLIRKIAITRPAMYIYNNTEFAWQPKMGFTMHLKFMIPLPTMIEYLEISSQLFSILDGKESFQSKSVWKESTTTMNKLRSINNATS